MGCHYRQRAACDIMLCHIATVRQHLNGCFSMQDNAGSYPQPSPYSSHLTLNIIDTACACLGLQPSAHPSVVMLTVCRQNCLVTKSCPYEVITLWSDCSWALHSGEGLPPDDHSALHLGPVRDMQLFKIPGVRCMLSARRLRLLIVCGLQLRMLQDPRDNVVYDVVPLRPHEELVIPAGDLVQRHIPAGRISEQALHSLLESRTSVS